MSDLYSNYYVCSKCGQPCGEVPTPTTFSNGQHWAGKSSCYNAPTVVKSTPYIVGTPLPPQARP